jgi:hypothetical protein
MRPTARSYRAAIALGTDARMRSPRRFATSNLSYPAMNVLPCAAQHFYVIRQDSLDVRDFSPRESIVFSNLAWSCRAVQSEDSLATSPDHMHVSRPVVVRVDYRAQSIKSQDCRHNEILSYPKRLGYYERSLDSRTRSHLSCEIRSGQGFQKSGGDGDNEDNAIGIENEETRTRHQVLGTRY